MKVRSYLIGGLGREAECVGNGAVAEDARNEGDRREKRLRVRI